MTLLTLVTVPSSRPVTASHRPRAHAISLLFHACSERPELSLLFPKKQQLCFRRDVDLDFAHVGPNRLCCPLMAASCSCGPTGASPRFLAAFGPSSNYMINLIALLPSQPPPRILIGSTNESLDFQHPQLDQGFSSGPSFFLKPFRRGAFDKIHQLFCNKWIQSPFPT